MPYYGGFPATYQSPYSQYPQNLQHQSQQNGVIWVQGEAGAKSYLVAPNSTVQLWDSESQTIYLKSADASGMPSMKVLDYTIRENAQNRANYPAPDQNDKFSGYATKEEIRAISDEMAALQKRIEKMEVHDE